MLGLAILYSHRDDSCRILDDMEGQAGWAYAWSGIGADWHRVVEHGLNNWPTGKHGMWDCNVDWPPCANGLEMTPDEVLFPAAADHCLTAAYQGRCPGIDPDELIEWRMQNRGQFQGRPAGELLADVAKARVALRAAARLELAPGVPEVADMRGGHVPELPDAAAREGVCFVAVGMPTPDGRKKVVCMGGTPEQTIAFRDVWAPENGLVGIYAIPERGIAGGYLS